MATGKPAFTGATTAIIHEAILGRAPSPASAVNARIPPELDRIIGKALEKDRELRYRHAADMCADLKRLKRDTDSSKSAPVIAVPAGIPAVPRHRKLRWLYAAGAVVIVAAAALFWLSRPLPPPRVTGTVQITNDGFPKTWPLLTDGSRLFFNSSSVTYEPYQVSVKGGDTVALRRPVNHAGVEDVSPSRTEMLLCRDIDTGGPCELWVAPLLGGSARRLGDLLARRGSAAWSPDGQQVAYARDKDVCVARNDGTEVRKLVTVAGEPYWVRWSPGGDRVRFTVDPGIGVADSLWEARLDGNRAYPLLPGWSPKSDVCCGNWTPDGKYFVFQRSGEGSVNVWALREKVRLFQRTARGPFQLTNGPLRTFWPVPSTDGKRLFIMGETDTQRNEFLRYDLKSGKLVPYTGLAGISGTELEFSKDGRWVAYTDFASGSLWRSASDGSQRLQLTSPPTWGRHPHWSPDGKQIAFNGARGNNEARIYVVPFDGGALKQVSNGESGKAGDRDPSWSPDGASLAFGCDSTVARGTSIHVVHVVDLKTGRVSPLPGSEGMWSPRWSPKGRFMAGLSEAYLSKIVLYDFQTRKQSELSSAGAYPSWSPDGESLFYATWHEEGAWWRVRMRDRKTERVMPLQNTRVFLWFAQAPNNSLITTRTVSASEIHALDWEGP